MNYKIDNLQYCYWSREIFKINREAEVPSKNVTLHIPADKCCIYCEEKLI